MARPSKTSAPDTTKTIELTAGAIERLTCRSDIKAQAFLRDSKAPGLRVRVTNTGHKAFVFEAKLNRRTIRRTIGDARTWTIEDARREARRLAVLIDGGINPNEQERQQQAELEAARMAEQVRAVTAAQAWAAYIEERRPHWGERHHLDHINMGRPGGRQRKRGEGLTNPGPLAGLLSLELQQLTPETIAAWAKREGANRPTQARLAVRLLRAFLNWCSEQPGLAAVANPQAVQNTRAREALGQAKPKNDALLKEQLPAWFAAARGLPAVPSAYVQALLLTGARPGELLGLRWEDVNTQWRGLAIRDKVEGERVIPLTPYVWHLLAGLPRRGEFVFQSERTDRPINRPTKHLERLSAAAGVHVTLHGLRRSFGSLSEWLELPAGVVAQIMGHKPSATAEKHYRVRPLDLLRVHHERLEAWILEQAGVKFDANAEPGQLRVVANS